MTSFKDILGRDWNVSIHVGTVRRVRDRLGINLLSDELGEVLKRVLCDVVMLCDVLFVVIEDEAKERGVSDVDFGRAMAGDALEEGAKAFLSALAAFTPNPRDRARVGKLVGVVLEAAEQIRNRADAELPEVLDRLKKEMTSGAPSSSSQASPASSPGG